MRMGDTIVACATGPGRSPRAIIRMSGPSAQAALDALCKPGVPEVRGAFASRVLIGALTCPVLVVRMPAPRSYTGEDCAEIQCPGNPALVTRLVDALVALPGVRQAEPGEFSARAYLSGKLSLDEAEGVAATIAAQTRGQLDSARSLLEGRSGQAYRRWAEELATLLALVEAGIDFTDQEDVVPIAPLALAKRLIALKDTIGGHLGASAAESSDERPRVVLAGVPNAGQSTLFNALLGRKRAVVSAVAGTTRDVLAERLDLSRLVPGAGEVELVDLAGLDELASGAIDEAAQAAARRAIAEASVVVQCDPSGVFEAVAGAAPTVIRVRTKADSGRAAPAGDSLPVCALDGWNLEELKRRIAAAAWRGSGALDQVLVVVPRHRRALSATALSVGVAVDAVDARARTLVEPEIIASQLRLALDQLGEVTGHISPDEVLGRVFSTFCVGK
jgi:tRNA modification GTPase